MGRTREAYIYRRAYDLARSGAHINSVTIISALVGEGYDEATEMLNSDLIRADLDRVCHWIIAGRRSSRRVINN